MVRSTEGPASCRSFEARIRATTVSGCLALMYVSAILCLGWATESALTDVRAPGSAPAESILVLAAAGSAWAVMTWLVIGCLLATVTSVSDLAAAKLGGLCAAITPGFARRAIGVALGITLLGGPGLSGAAPAMAAEIAVTAGAGDSKLPKKADATVAPHDEEIQFGLPDGWTPDRPAAPRRPGSPGHRHGGSLRLATSTPHAETAVAETVTVQRGDTLWSIAAAHLARRLGSPAGAGPGDAEVAAEWPRWYEANRSVIGPDPGVILPGQLLRPPAT
jgi:hypothetical protein